MIISPGPSEDPLAKRGEKPPKMSRKSNVPISFFREFMLSRRVILLRAFNFAAKLLINGVIEKH